MLKELSCLGSEIFFQVESNPFFNNIIHQTKSEEFAIRDLSNQFVDSMPIFFSQGNLACLCHHHTPQNLAQRLA